MSKQINHESAFAQGYGVTGLHESTRFFLGERACELREWTRKNFKSRSALLLPPVAAVYDRRSNSRYGRIFATVVDRR
jgi:hypothetical protein